MTELELVSRIDRLIEELIPMGTLESAAIASILLATRAALRDGCVIGAAQAVWLCVDRRSSESNGDHS